MKTKNMKTKKLKIPYSLVLAALFAVALGLIAFSSQRISNGNLIVETAIANLKDIQSFEAVFSLTTVGLGTASGDNLSIGAMDIVATTTLNTINKEKQVYVVLSGDVVSDEMPEIPFNFALEMFLMPQSKLYLRLNEIPAILSAFLNQDMLNSLANVWVYFDLTADGANTETLTKNFTKDAGKLFKGQSFFIVEQDMGIEGVRGQSMHHLKVNLNKETLKKIIPKYVELANKYASTESKQAVESQMQELVKVAPQAIDGFWDETGGIVFDVWLSEDDMYLRRIEVVKTIAEFSFALTLEINKIGEAFLLEAPSDAKTFEEIFAGFGDVNNLAPVVPVEN